jgi:hypothetical protein
MDAETTPKSPEAVRATEAERAAKVRSIMAYTTGTEAYHRLSLAPLNCTDSIKYIAEAVGAFWLVEAVACEYTRPRAQEYRDFLVVEFHVEPGGRAWIHLRPDTGAQSVATQEIPFTDFPVGLWKFYIVDGVLMCPGDY